MKKFIALFLTVAMTAGLLSGCGAPAKKDPGSTGEKGKKVVFLVNGNLGDKGFYDSCNAGVNELATSYGCEVKTIEMGRDETAYESYFRDVSEQDWDLIIAATWSVKELFETIAAEYPDNNYLFLDGEIKTPNMVGVSYMSNETGFMAGCLAALMLDSGDAKIDASNRTLGFIGSMDTTNINDFMVGYMDGIQYIDKSIRVITSYVGSFEDVATCLEMTTQLYNQGAQVVYCPTSQSQIGAVTASSDCDKYLIACDTDVYNEMVETDAKIVRNVLSSSLKKAGDSVVVAANGFWDGTMKPGSNYSLGIKQNTVGLADNANYQALVPQKTRDQLKDIAAKVAAGDITMDNAYKMETSEIVALRDSMKP